MSGVINWIRGKSVTPNDKLQSKSHSTEPAQKPIDRNRSGNTDPNKPVNHRSNIQPLKSPPLRISNSGGGGGGGRIGGSDSGNGSGGMEIRIAVKLVKSSGSASVGAAPVTHSTASLG